MLWTGGVWGEGECGGVVADVLPSHFRARASAVTHGARVWGFNREVVRRPCSCLEPPFCCAMLHIPLFLQDNLNVQEELVKLQEDVASLQGQNLQLRSVHDQVALETWKWNGVGYGVVRGPLDLRTYPCYSWRKATWVLQAWPSPCGLQETQGTTPMHCVYRLQMDVYKPQITVYKLRRGVSKSRDARCTDMVSAYAYTKMRRAMCHAYVCAFLYTQKQCTWRGVYFCAPTYSRAVRIEGEGVRMEPNK